MILGIYRSDISIYEDPALYKEHLELSSDERRHKIERIKPEKSKKLSLLCTHMLDEALKEFSLREKDMAYGYNEHGKPFFSERPDIVFNFSHSGDHALLCIDMSNASLKDKETKQAGISKSHFTIKNVPDEYVLGIGCDIEKIRPPEKGTLKIAERFFHQKEKDHIASIRDVSDRDKAFCLIWTLKESYLKAGGSGLSKALDSFSVLPYDGNVIFEDNEMTHGETECHFEILGTAGGYCASACVITGRKDEL
ncbi:MAG: 4'-phosphopantetheinyl transferase superfamily protein [Lachnospiraceae bacterium]|nr:4'-phosphopantetheinyl transferase superfamily protein [Lachnospiraceae bacterium]